VCEAGLQFCAQQVIVAREFTGKVVRRYFQDY
jgi:hypothetical protein